MIWIKPEWKKAIVKKTGNMVLVRDMGENFHPRFWSKSHGFSKGELSFNKKLRKVI